MGEQGAPLAVVILNWNGAADTVACLESIERDGPTGVDAIVVDNGSEPGDVAAVERALGRWPWARLVRSGENLGFAEGCNVGIRLALARGSEFVMLLNNDARVERGALDTLVAHMRAHPKVGLASPLILDASGERIWAAGGVRRCREIVCSLGMAGAPADRAPAEPFEAYALIGCAIVARREVFETAGELDAEYFAYVEDVDFSLRARAAGWTLAVVPPARIRHHVSRSTGGGYTPLRSYLLGRGTALFVRRRADAGQRLGFALVAPIALVAAALRELPRGNLGAVVAKAHGILDGLLRRKVDRRYFG